MMGRQEWRRQWQQRARQLPLRLGCHSTWLSHSALSQLAGLPLLGAGAAPLAPPCHPGGRELLGPK